MANYFNIDKIKNFFTCKWYWASIRKDLEDHAQGYNICLLFEKVKYKPYGDFQLLPILTHRKKDFSPDFVIRLLVSIDLKAETYDCIQIIINRFPKIVYCELVKITINAPKLAKVVLDILVWHSRLPNLIIINKAYYLPLSSNHCFVILLRLSDNFLPPLTYRQTAK